jgi:putative transposase
VDKVFAQYGVAQQARNASMQLAEWNLGATHSIIDRDSKFAGFDSVFEAESVEIVRVGPAAPNFNAFAERRVRTLRRECLDHFVICGEAHLRHLVRESVAQDNTECPHQGVGNTLPDADNNGPQGSSVPCNGAKRRSRLGGLLKYSHYPDACPRSRFTFQ